MTLEPAAELPPFAIVVVSFASSGLLERNAARIAVPPAGRIVVVDCFSTALERERVRELAAANGWEAVLLDANAGFGGGTNAGAARAVAAGARVLVALNPDASIDRASLESLVRAAHADPMALVSPTITTSDGRPWFDGADLYLDDGSVRPAAARARFEGTRRLAWATGACFAISVRLWEELGGFDEEYFLYWEDIDLSHRALALGARLEAAAASVVHDAGGTQAEERPARAKSELYYYFNIRNRLLYATKHLEADGIRRWSRSAPRVGLDVLRRGGHRQLLTSVRPWRAYLRALRDGRRVVRRRRRDRALGTVPM